MNSISTQIYNNRLIRYYAEKVWAGKSFMFCGECLTVRRSKDKEYFSVSGKMYGGLGGDFNYVMRGLEDEFAFRTLNYSLYLDRPILKRRKGRI